MSKRRPMKLGEVTKPAPSPSKPSENTSTAAKSAQPEARNTSTAARNTSKPTPNPSTAARKPRKRRLRVSAQPEVAPTPAESVLEPVVPSSTRERSPEIQAAVDEAFNSMPYEPPLFDSVGAALTPEQELAQRELARRRLLPFIQRFRPKYKAGWVHADICRRIERFVEAVERGESPRLLLMMPPRSGKSEISSRHTPAWILGKHPDWEIIAGSHTSSLSMSFSRYLRDLMRDPAYQSIFEDTRLDPSSQSTENWNLTKGGGYLAAGVGTGITGRGAHVLLLDDLVKDIEAADSQTIRDNTWEWYLSTAYTRLAPGGGVLGVMTWWHEDDWAGRIQQVMESGDGDDFEIIRYPAINESGDEYLLEDDNIVEITSGSPVPENARMTRPMGTAIHPERYTTEAMLKIKRNLVAGGQKRVWDALYQQNPLPDDGSFFTRDMFMIYGTAPRRPDLYVYQAWDFAITEGTENDYTVGTCLGQDHRGNLYVLDQRRFKSGDSFIIVDAILDFAQEWQVDMLGFEDGQIWKAMDAVFMKECEARKYHPSYEKLTPLTDKRVRATPLRGLMQHHKVFFDKNAHYFTELQKEMLRFLVAKHDDQVDSLAWAVRLTLTKSAPRREVANDEPPTDSWRKRLDGMVSGSGGSHMSA